MKNRKKWTRLFGTVVVIAMIILASLNIYLGLFPRETEVIEGISENLIRFHVIGSSDREEDQAVKIKVKDAVIVKMEELLKEAKTVEQSREIILQNIDFFKKLAEDTLLINGFHETVEVTLQKEKFPLKQYGDILLPPGDYEALVIRIGKAEGKNWWCVLFPPLCFVDATHGVVDEDSKEELQHVLTDDEYNAILMDPDEETKIHIKIKFFEWLKSKENALNNQ